MSVGVREGMQYNFWHWRT